MAQVRNTGKPAVRETPPPPPPPPGNHKPRTLLIFIGRAWALYAAGNDLIRAWSIAAECESALGVDDGTVYPASAFSDASLAFELVVLGHSVEEAKARVAAFNAHAASLGLVAADLIGEAEGTPVQD